MMTNMDVLVVAGIVVLVSSAARWLNYLSFHFFLYALVGQPKMAVHKSTDGLFPVWTSGPCKDQGQTVL